MRHKLDYEFHFASSPETSHVRKDRNTLKRSQVFDLIAEGRQSFLSLKELRRIDKKSPPKRAILIGCFLFSPNQHLPFLSLCKAERLNTFFRFFLTKGQKTSSFFRHYFFSFYFLFFKYFVFCQTGKELRQDLKSPFKMLQQLEQFRPSLKIYSLLSYLT